MSEPITYTTAREQDRAEGFRAGIEAAAQLARAHAATQVHATFGPEATLQDALAIGYQQCGDAIERAIRALTTKPAPDAVSPAAKDAASGAAGADNAPADPADWTEYEERMIDEIAAAAEHGPDVVANVLAREEARLALAPADTAKRIREHAQRLQQSKRGR